MELTLLKIISAKILIHQGFNFSAFFLLFVWWEKQASLFVEIGNEKSCKKLHKKFLTKFTTLMMPPMYQEVTWGLQKNNGTFAKLNFWEVCVKPIPNEITFTKVFQSTFSKHNLESNTSCKVGLLLPRQYVSYCT